LQKRQISVIIAPMSIFSIDNLMKVGAHYGYTRTRRHPSTKSYVATSSNGVDFIDLEKTIADFDKAVALLKSVAAANKQILFVGTKPEIRQTVKEIALSMNQPYVADRYIGGAITNFPQIKKRIEKLHELLSKKEKGELAVYTKKEQMLIQKDIERLDRNFGGLSNVTGLPGAIVIVDAKKEDMCIKEAQRMRIPVVALANTDCDINGIEYPIVCNEGAPVSVRTFLEAIKKELA
jgi:small subunit ribosomal protein S2